MSATYERNINFAYTDILTNDAFWIPEPLWLFIVVICEKRDD